MAKDDLNHETIDDERFKNLTRREIVEAIHKWENRPITDKLKDILTIRNGAELGLVGFCAWAFMQGHIVLPFMQPPEKAVLSDPAAILAEDGLKHVENNIDDVRALIREEVHDLGDDLSADHERIERLVQKVWERLPTPREGRK
jgi:hypothetical protein